MPNPAPKIPIILKLGLSIPVNIRKKKIAKIRSEKDFNKGNFFFIF